ncbi:hypothetical protein GHT06_016837 [Daphnia sinensis]|uniref:ANKLE2 third alpha/beta domain-containing protein n=1 Tax=Daphnia sinensis TaxID=1820382 RepID=A0AAD5PVI0_9CRUS|nr:hypothetical protein GHT06_016837 [Daphnia sinensis]
MSGATFYGVSLLEGQEQGQQTELVFEDRVEALKICKKFKGARFKCFTERDEAVLFTQTKQTQPETDVVIKELPSEKLPFPNPSPQEMLHFRRIIETGNCEEFLVLVWKNPRFLISAGDTPTMIRERYRYHGLLLATFKKSFPICKALLDTITDPRFIGLLYVNDAEHVRKNRMFYLLDTYLNTPDKFLNETPLHFASKFGLLDILELFLSFPECDRERKNTRGETPVDIICSSCKNPSPELEAQMRSLLSQRYFVPVLRPIDLSSPARIGKPWSPDVTPKSPESLVPNSPLSHQKYPVDSQMMLQALAGPMSPTEAELFYRQMKTPPVPKFYQNRLSDKKMTPIKMMDSRLSDIDKGLERVGRNIAQDLNVPWVEYWKFLDEFCDLCSSEGLRKLENYFRRKRNEVEECQASPNFEAQSPLSDLCNKLSQLHLQSPEVLENGNDEFFTPPSTPPATFYEISPFYIFGSQPSKTDVDVLRVLENVELDFSKYPNVSMWRENMMQYNEDHLNKLKTPARTNIMNSTLKSPLPETHPHSPRISSITKCLNSPRKTRDVPVVRARLSERFEDT